VVLSAVAQRIVKFLITEKVKPADILKRLRAQFEDETLSRTQVYGCVESFKEGRKEVEKNVKITPSERTVTASDFGIPQVSYS
jgi:hypothetical protein